MYETTAAVLLAEDEEKARAISAEFDRERKAHVEERPKGPWEKFKGWAMSGLTPAGQDIKPIFEHEEGKVLEAVQKTQEEKVKNELAAQGSASSGPVLVAVKDEEEKKSRGVMDRVKGLWGGGSK